jgi:hypothetical protein
MALRQPETGTIILKPIVEYQVGGALGAVQRARYSVNIVVKENTVTMDFELGREIVQGTWAPESEIPKIKTTFRSVAARVATALQGTLE